MAPIMSDLRPRTATSKLVRESQEVVLSPPAEDSGWHLLDLDTGRYPRWPAEIPRQQDAETILLLEQWAEKSGADLLCLAQPVPNGTFTYELRGLGLDIRALSARESRQLKIAVEQGSLPRGVAVKDQRLLVSKDDPPTSYLVVTRDGTVLRLDLTDEVTVARDVTGAFMREKGVGFHTGVRFDINRVITPVQPHD